MSPICSVKDIHATAEGRCSIRPVGGLRFRAKRKRSFTAQASWGPLHGVALPGRLAQLCADALRSTVVPGARAVGGVRLGAGRIPEAAFDPV